MDTEAKANRIYIAARKLSQEYANEGNTAAADQVAEAFRGLPRDSAARLFDILNAPPAPVEPWENIGSTTAD